MRLIYKLNGCSYFISIDIMYPVDFFFHLDFRIPIKMMTVRVLIVS